MEDTTKSASGPSRNPPPITAPYTKSSSPPLPPAILLLQDVLDRQHFRLTTTIAASRHVLSNSQPPMANIENTAQATHRAMANNSTTTSPEPTHLLVPPFFFSGLSRGFVSLLSSSSFLGTSPISFLFGGCINIYLYYLSFFPIVFLFLFRQRRSYLGCRHGYGITAWEIGVIDNGMDASSLS